MNELKIIIIVGQTAVGKSSFAFELAKEISAEIISCDSRQIYKLMDIGTDKPSLEKRKEIPHHMLDIIYPDEKYSAAQYGTEARKRIKEIKRAGKNVIVVGGSGLYIRALLDGIFEGPGEDSNLRKKIEKEANEFGSLYLFEKLKKIDPQIIKKIHVNDKRRIIRALEIYELTGKTIFQLQKEGNYEKLEDNFEIRGMICNKEELHKKIEERIAKMIKNGLIDEVKELTKKYSKDLPSMQALGYKEVIGYLEGKFNLEEMISVFKYNTKQYAKRQLTWFKKDKRIKWFENS